MNGIVTARFRSARRPDEPLNVGEQRQKHVAVAHANDRVVVVNNGEDLYAQAR
jgi:hypothetical protein